MLEFRILIQKTEVVSSQLCSDRKGLRQNLYCFYPLKLLICKPKGPTFTQMLSDRQ